MAFTLSIVQTTLPTSTHSCNVWEKKCGQTRSISTSTSSSLMRQAENYHLSLLATELLAHSVYIRIVLRPKTDMSSLRCVELGAKRDLTDLWWAHHYMHLTARHDKFTEILIQHLFVFQDTESLIFLVPPGSFITWLYTWLHIGFGFFLCKKKARFKFVLILFCVK